MTQILLNNMDNFNFQIFSFLSNGYLTYFRLDLLQIGHPIMFVKLLVF